MADLDDGGIDLPRTVPGLTLVGHPDGSRIGEVAPLPELASGGRVPLSRLEPAFGSRGRVPGPPGPLADPHLSRRPAWLRGRLDDGGIVLDLDGCRTAVAVGGEPVADGVVLSADDLDRGVVIELGHRVVVLLHRIAPAPSATPERTAPAAGSAGGLIGASLAMEHLREEIAKAARLSVPVLVRGETGTGKELVARALHEASSRRDRPFVAVNLAALAPNLAAAELFGAVKGAYTGADRAKQGYFRRARGGTLFLDEIGEAPHEVQVLLLRALEAGEITPVGSTDPISVDTRVVAATDADLERAMASGRFRAPLLHRLSGYGLQVPSLRERRDDIGRLFWHFLERERRRHAPAFESRSEAPWPTSALVARLVDFDWPGNVRQLRNVARWAALTGPSASPVGLVALLAGPEPPPSASPFDSTIDIPAPEVAPPEVPLPEVPRPPRLYRSPREIGEGELLAALRENGWRVKPTAAALGVSRTSLYALIDRCPGLRRAADLGLQELEVAYDRHGGDLGAMANELEVSPQGLRHRLQELGIGRGPIIRGRERPPGEPRP